MSDDLSTFLNIILLLIQTLIIFGQLRLSSKINNQAISKERGYFLLGECNFPISTDLKGKFKDIYNLKEEVFFLISGNNDVIVTNINYSIDGVMHTSGVPRNTYYQNSEKLNTLAIKFDIKESDYAKKSLDIIVCFFLKNPSGYKYKETIYITFTKRSNDGLWDIKKYNLEFGK